MFFSVKKINLSELNKYNTIEDIELNCNSWIVKLFPESLKLKCLASRFRSK